MKMSSSSSCYLTDMEHFNTHRWSNECEQTKENGRYNVNGINNCKKTIIPTFVCIRQKILINVLKQFWETCLIKTAKLQKNVNFLGTFNI